MIKEDKNDKKTKQLGKKEKISSTRKNHIVLFYFIIPSILLIFFVFSIIHKSYNLMELYLDFTEIVYLYKENNSLAFIFFFILGDFLIMYFFLPFFFLYNLFISLIMTDMVFAYQLIFFGSTFCSLICFYIYRKIFPKKVINLLSFIKPIDDFAIVCLLDNEYFILIFVRFLFLPQSIIEAILAYVTKSFWSFLLVTVFFHSFNSLIIIYIGQHFYSFINFKFHDWFFLKTIEKFNFFVLIFVVFLY